MPGMPFASPYGDPIVPPSSLGPQAYQQVLRTMRDNDDQDDDSAAWGRMYITDWPDGQDPVGLDGEDMNLEVPRQLWLDWGRPKRIVVQCAPVPER